MKLTNSQINQLYKFTKKHYVEHYDVQTELVDHLANDIEEIWQENPSLSFEEARDKSFKKFGIFGFMDVVEAKQKQMNKRYAKFMWRFFKEWFTVPKILTTSVIFLSIFFFLKIQYSGLILVCSLLLLIIYDIVLQLILRKKQKVKKKKKEKVFLLESLIGETRSSFSSISAINILNVLNFSNTSFTSMENHWLLLISFSATIILILFYVTAYIIPQKSEELLIETYPEYKLSQNL